MDGKRTTSKKVDEILNSVDGIETVKAPPFFKERTLQRLSQDHGKVAAPNLLGWFTPGYQVAAILVFIALNLFTLYSYYSSNEQQELQTFAQNYGLSTSNSESILN